MSRSGQRIRIRVHARVSVQASCRLQRICTWGRTSRVRLTRPYPEFLVLLGSSRSTPTARTAPLGGQRSGRFGVGRMRQRTFPLRQGLAVRGMAVFRRDKHQAAVQLGTLPRPMLRLTMNAETDGGETEVDIAAQDFAVKGVFWRRPAADVGRQLLPSRTTHRSKSVSRSRGNRFAQIEGAKWMLKIASTCHQ